MLGKIDIAKLKSGDLKEFRCLFDALYPKLLSLGSRFVPVSVAEDMVQDVFAMYWEQKEFIDTYQLQSYLYKSLQNRCLNYIKRQEVEDNYSTHLKIAQARAEYMNTYLEENDILKNISANELRQRLEAELSNLSPRVAEAFRLCYYDDLNHKEVAEAMGISVRTAETHVHQAILALRNTFGNKELLVAVTVLTLFN